MGKLIRGTVPIEEWDEAERLRKRFTQLYRLFFFPDDMTEMDRMLEDQYIEGKLQKVYSYSNSNVS